MRLEDAHDLARGIGDLGRPRYEALPDHALFDGSAQVEDFLEENRRAFPLFRSAPAGVTPVDDVVLVEGVFRGTFLNHPVTILRAGLRTARLWITRSER